MKEKLNFEVCDGDDSSYRTANGTSFVKASEETEWSQHDQRLFEAALQQFPKGTADR